LPAWKASSFYIHPRRWNKPASKTTSPQILSKLKRVEAKLWKFTRIWVSIREGSLLADFPGSNEFFSSLG
jgi:hypothetical protein